MLSSMGIESPMFDYLEQVSQPSHAASRPAVAQVNVAEKMAERNFYQLFGRGMGAISREKDQKRLAAVALSKTDIELIKSYMEILDEVCFNSVCTNDMKTDIAREMYQYSQAVYSRCLRLIEAKSAHGVSHQMDVLSNLAEALDVRLKLFKNTFVDLSIKEKSPPSIKQIKENSPSEKKEEKKEINNKDKQIEEEKKVVKKPELKPLPPPPSNPFFQFETKAEPLIDLLEVEEQKKEEKKQDNLSAILSLNLGGGDAKENVVPVPKPEIKPENPKNKEDDFFEDLANRK